MKTLGIIKYLLWLGAFVALASVGCGQNSARGHKFGNSGAGEPVGPNSETGGYTQGTVDGGGGAGFKGKPLESYRRNIEDLALFPEFELVEGVLKSIERIKPEHAKIFRHIIRNRTWLFLNEPVPQISAARQGLPYNFDQWAVQNSKEIWMSDQYKGDAQAKAKILLHEILVGLKIMRFLSYNEYCYQWTSNRALCDDSGNEVLIANYKLNDLDHADVRNQGEWLWQHHARMTAEQFGAQMHANQFHSPHYSWKPESLSILEERPVNPVVARLHERTHELFTDWGPDGIARKKCVLEFKQDPENKHVAVKIEVMDLSTGKSSRQISFALAFDAEKNQNSTLNTNYYGRTLRWSSSDGREMKKVGDSSISATVEFSNLSVVSFFSGDSQVKSVSADGATHSESNADGPNGLSCEKSPIALPTQYELWLEMRAHDRELLERRQYGGKTVAELLRQLDAKPEYKLAN